MTPETSVDRVRLGELLGRRVACSGKEPKGPTDPPGGAHVTHEAQPERNDSTAPTVSVASRSRPSTMSMTPLIRSLVGRVSNPARTCRQCFDIFDRPAASQVEATIQTASDDVAPSTSWSNDARR